MTQAVLDPGVLVSAALAPRGVCGQVLIAAIDDRYILVTSPALLAELEEVLLRPKFRRSLSEEEAHRYVALVAGISRVQPDPPGTSGLTPDPDDDYLIALARDVDADYLVSGDHHLTGLSDPPPAILTPRIFLERLDEPPNADC